MDVSACLQTAVDLAVRAHEQSSVLPDNHPPGTLPADTKPQGRLRVSMLSQVFPHPSLPLASLGSPVISTRHISVPSNSWSEDMKGFDGLCAAGKERVEHGGGDGRAGRPSADGAARRAMAHGRGASLALALQDHRCPLPTPVFTLLRSHGPACMHLPSKHLGMLVHLSCGDLFSGGVGVNLDMTLSGIPRMFSGAEVAEAHMPFADPACVCGVQRTRCASW